MSVHRPVFTFFFVLFFVPASMPVPSAFAAGELPDERPGVSYELPADGNVSLGIFDEQGRLLRTLLQAEPRPKGTHSEPWDGLDQYGEALPAGEYRLKAIHLPPLELDYAYSVGNPGTPPWPTPDDCGDWMSDEANPQAAATDGTWVFLAAPGAEKGHAIIAVDENGERVWGRCEPIYPRAVSLAVDGDYLYVAFSGPVTVRDKQIKGRALIECIDKKTGRPARFSTGTPRLEVHEWPYKEEVFSLAGLRKTQSFSPATYAGQPRYFGENLGESDNVLGIAAMNGSLFLSCFYEDKILVLDAETGGKVGEIPVAKPVGLHPRDADALYAVSDGKVVLINLKTKKITPLIEKHLSAPFGITTDAQGRIYVSDWGNSFQVKRFGKDGKPEKAFGKKGGRPWYGPWKTDGFLLPRGIAVTNNGKLWVAEDDSTPKRVSVWNTETFAFEKEYLGPTPYGGTAMFDIDRRDPSIVYAMGMKFRVDLKTKEWKPLATQFRRMDPLEAFVTDGSNLMSRLQHRVLPDGSEIFVVFGKEMIILGRENAVGRVVPFAAAGGLSRLITDASGRGQILWDSDIGRHLYKNYWPEAFEGWAGMNFSWYDGNGDGLVQTGEMNRLRTFNRFENSRVGTSEGDPSTDGKPLQAEWLASWAAGIGPDFTIFYNGFCRDRQYVYRLDPHWTERDGKKVPTYNIGDAQVIVEHNPSCWINGEFASSDGKVLVWYDYRPEDGDPNRHKNAVEYYDRDGKLLWGIANSPKAKLRGKAVHADNASGEMNVPGIGRVFGTFLWHGSFQSLLINEDGLFVGAPHGERERMPGPDGLWDESFRSYHQSEDGTCWFMNGANDAFHVFRLRNLDKGGRIDAKFSYTSEMVEAAKRRRDAQALLPPPVKPILRAVWAATPPVIDGKLDDWNMNEGIAVGAASNGEDLPGNAPADKPTRNFDACIQRDEVNLYLAFHVRKDRPFANAGENWQTLFISGDCVDFHFAADPSLLATRSQAGAGDTRLLFSMFQDKPICVKYRPNVPGTTAPHRLMAAPIDEIIRLDSAKVAITPNANGSEKEYIVEASVPLSELGIDAKNSKGASFKADLGVVFADATGRSRALRLYHYNKKTSMTADLSTEATLQPAEWGVLQMSMGRNLLRDGGFECGFVDEETTGWKILASREGMDVSLDSAGSHSGQTHLKFLQTKPVTFPEGDDVKEPDYGKYIQSANEGRGGGWAELAQTFPVEGGKKYHFRFYLRTKDMHWEQKRQVAGRGYTTLIVNAYWRGAPDGIWVLNCQEDVPEWAGMTDRQQNVFSVTVPYSAPPGTTSVRMILNARCNAADRLPCMEVDDLEFVEVDE